MNKHRAVFLVLLLVLVGADASKAQQLLVEYLFTDHLPATDLFLFVFRVIWMPGAILTILSGVVGGYLTLRRNTLNSDYLVPFAAAQCIVLKVGDIDLSWSAYQLSFSFYLDQFGLGCNFLGVAFALWLTRLRQVGGVSVPATNPLEETEPKAM